MTNACITDLNCDCGNKKGVNESECEDGKKNAGGIPGGTQSGGTKIGEGDSKEGWPCNTDSDCKGVGQICDPHLKICKDQ